MGALYLMTFAGVSDFGGGAVYIGNGKILGVDVGNVRYKGTYTQSGDRMKLSATMTAPNGAKLVTGMELPAGSKLNLTADWPSNFDNGQQLPILVEGRPVHVTFEKIDDI